MWSDTNERYLEWLLSPPGTLRDIEDTCTDVLEEHGCRHDLFTKHGPSILSFTGFSLLTKLDVLIMRRMPFAPLKLPGTVRHVGYHWLPDDDLSDEDDEAEDMVRSFMEAPKELKDLRLVTTTRSTGEHTLKMFEVICRSLDVELVV